MFELDPAFKRRVEAMQRRAMIRQGAIVQRIAKRSIRPGPKRKQITTGPPRNRTGALKYFIRFAYDPRTKSVVVGPVDLPKPIDGQPTTLEFGGTGTVREKGGKRRRATYRARPFMQPALEEAQSKYPEAFDL